MEKNEHIEGGNNQDLSLKEILNLIQAYVKEIWKYKFYIILAGLLCGLFMSYKAYKQVPSYTASLTFMLNDEKSSGGGGLGSILGAIGIQTRMGNGKNNLDRILELSKSRKIAQKAFFKKVKINEKEDFFSNHIIEYFEDLDQWSSKPWFVFWGEESKLTDFRFTHDSLANFTRLENLAWLKIHRMIVGGQGSNLFSTNYNEDTGIMNFATTSMTEDISISLTNSLFEALSTYYKDKAIEKQKYTYGLVKSKTDSIEAKVKSYEYRLAQLRDSKRSIFKNQDKLEDVQLQGKIKIGYAALAQAMENLEIADFAVKNSTPFIQVIDQPVSPLIPQKDSFINAFLKWCILGSCLVVTYVVLRKIITDTLSS